MHTSDKKRAFSNARLFYEELVSSDIVARLSVRKCETSDATIFSVLAIKVLELESGKVHRGELTEKSLKITRYRLNK